MELVDTHCHIQSAGLAEGERTTREIWAKDKSLNGEVLVTSAVEASVTRLICVGCDLADSRLAVNFVQNHDNCWASIGIHPHEAKHFADRTELLKEFATLAEDSKVIAVGECGYDFYYNHSPKDTQTEVLKFQIELALKNNLPLVFHVREAFDDFWPVFDAHKGIKGVLHSYTDSGANLEKALERGLFIGVNGIATFARNDALLTVYKNIPEDRLLLETDAPFLTPAPNRGKINEPKYVGAVAEFMAELRGVSLEKLASATTTNANRLFGLQ